MNVDEMTMDEMALDKMTIDKMTRSQLIFSKSVQQYSFESRESWIFFSNGFIRSFFTTFEFENTADINKIIKINKINNISIVDVFFCLLDYKGLLK